MTMSVPKANPSAAIVSASAVPGSAPISTPTLPTPSTGVGLDDALSMIYAAMSALDASQTGSAQEQISLGKNKRVQAQAEREEALRRAREEAEKGGLFKSIAGDLGIGGVAGLATFNYALVAADFALHNSGLVKNLKLDVADGAAVLPGNPYVLAADIGLRKLDVAPDAIKQRLDALGIGTNVPGISDEDVKPLVEKAIAVNLFVVGATSSLFTAGSTSALVVASIGLALSAGAFTSSVAGGPEWLTLGLEIAGVACSAGSFFMAPPAKIGVAERVAQCASSASTGLNGADTVVRGSHQKAADDAQERAEAAKQTLKHLERVLDDLLDGIQESHESCQRVQQAAQETAQIHDQTLVAASTWRG